MSEEKDTISSEVAQKAIEIFELGQISEREHNFKFLLKIAERNDFESKQVQKIIRVLAKIIEENGNPTMEEIAKIIEAHND